MLLEAIEAKARETGRYSRRDLARDSDTDYSHIARVVRGERNPTPDILAAWSRVLEPHFPLDQALVEAGYAPADPMTRNILQRLVRLPADLRRRVFEAMGDFILTPPVSPPSEQGEEEDGGNDKSDATTDKRGEQ